MSFAPVSRRPTADINVTPLIDVVLVLLIVFMVLTPLSEKQMFMRVPEYEPPGMQVISPETAPPDQTVLTLLANGRVSLNRQQMTVDEAMEIIRVAYKGHPSKVLFFNAEDQANYALAVHVLDRAHLVGVNTIGLMTDPPLPTEVNAVPAGP